MSLAEAAPPELRIGHLVLEPGNPSRQEPPHVWAVVGYAGKIGGEIVTLKSAGFGDNLTRKVSIKRLPPGWLFIHSELLAGLLTRHAATRNEHSDIADCPVCAVFGGPGTVEAIQKAGH